jgi:biopolymer transport protein ExbD
MNLKVFDFSQFRKAQDVDTKINLSPILCMVTILSMFFLFNSRFVLSPGIDITLPVSDYAIDSDSIGFLTVKNEKFIILDGSVCSIDSLGKYLDSFLKRHKISDAKNLSMMVIGDESLPLGLLINVCDIVKSAGYGNVKIASQR